MMKIVNLKDLKRCEMKNYTDGRFENSQYRSFDVPRRGSVNIRQFVN